jgi:hypothetical protein
MPPLPNTPSWRGAQLKARRTYKRYRNVYKIFVVVPEWKRPLGRSRRRGEDNFRMDLRGIGWEVLD